MDGILSLANSGLAIVVVLGLCLMFHEFGHFITAKLCRMAVWEFSMGFGPLLWQRKRGETSYSVRAIPFGGYVQIAGMEPGDGEDIERGFHSRPRWQRILVIIAGTLMNVVLAVLVYWFANLATGMPVTGSNAIEVKSVFSKSAALEAGVRKGDQIVGVAGSQRSTEVRSVTKDSIAMDLGLRPGQRIFQIGEDPVGTPGDAARRLARGLKGKDKVWVVNPDAKDIGEAIIALTPTALKRLASIPAPPPAGQPDDGWAESALGALFNPMDQGTAQRALSLHPSEPVVMDLIRDGKPLTVTVTTRAETDRVEMVDENGKLSAPHREIGRIGIILGGETRRTGVYEGLRIAVEQSKGAVLMVVISIKAMVMGQVAAEPTGPIGIMAMTAETARLGWGAVAGLCGMISANLAVVNMAPIPPFDGFHVLLLLLEGLIGRRVDRRLEFAVRATGFALVIGVFLLLAFKDITSLVVHGTY